MYYQRRPRARSDSTSPSYPIVCPGVPPSLTDWQTLRGSGARFGGADPCQLQCFFVACPAMSFDPSTDDVLKAIRDSGFLPPHA
jgi:hypothetical protein